MYTMDIEYPVNVVKQHGFHLGTDFRIAEQIVLERLPHAISIALRKDGKLIKIYDFQDIEK